MIEVASGDMPARLHPASQMCLENYIGGSMSLENFPRFFSLPNSDYIPLAQCILQALNPMGLG